MATELKDLTYNDGDHIQECYPKEMQMPNYDNENPHPGFGKDPNIRNVQGHTEYPKYVTNKDGERVIVNNPTEEEEATGKGIAETDEAPKATTKKAAWGK